MCLSVHMPVCPSICLSVCQVWEETWSSRSLIKIEVWFLRPSLLLDVFFLIYFVYDSIAEKNQGGGRDRTVDWFKYNQWYFYGLLYNIIWFTYIGFKILKNLSVFLYIDIYLLCFYLIICKSLKLEKHWTTQYFNLCRQSVSVIYWQWLLN